MLRTKVIRAETKVLDIATGRVEAIVSDESKDRDGDIIRQDGWTNLDTFLRYAPLVSSHDYRQLRSIIGHWESMEVRGKKMVGVAQYMVAEGNPEADWGFKLAQKGMAAFSVGFIPDMAHAKELDGDGIFHSYDFGRQELLEVSQVVIPSNRNGLQRMKGANLHPAIAGIVDEVLRAEVSPAWDLWSSVPEEFRTYLEHLHLRVGDLDWLLQIRGAIPAHETPKLDEDADWDAGVEVGEAEGRSQLRRMHAWVDGEGDPETKGAYKLPHHMNEGQQVVWRGVAAAMAALMGGRGGVDIPTGDRRGVYDHLRRHYGQFDKEPPEFRHVDTDSLMREALHRTWEGG
tara:strand:+ start:2502 stop:3533 length:1032 start_codon:yes stop_codon:yes gene_type:complete